jgi:hypothetical protein
MVRSLRVSRGILFRRRRTTEHLVAPNPSWPDLPRKESSSWSTIQANMPRPMVGGSLNSTTANRSMRRCSRDVLHATSPQKLAILSSPAMLIDFSYPLASVVPVGRWAASRHIAFHEGGTSMKKLAVLCITLCFSLSSNLASARGGGHGGSHHTSGTGGAAGTGVGSPGTNSSGTALSSGGGGNGVQKASFGGTNPVVDREEVRVDKMIKSICRGC